MGSCFRFSFKKKQSYAFNNQEQYTPTREEPGRYRASVTVQSWTEPREGDIVYSPNNKQNGYHNGHHSPQPITPTKQHHAENNIHAIYDRADPVSHVTRKDEDRHSVSSKGSAELKPNGHVGEKDGDSIHSEEAQPEPVVVAVKKPKVKEIPVHDMENPPPFNHKLNDYQKTCIEMEDDDDFHEHGTVVLGAYDGPAMNGGHDDDDVSSISSHPSVHLDQVELEAEQNNLNEQTVTSQHQDYVEYDSDVEDNHTPHELVY